MSEIRLQVTGYPAPQGSKKAWVNKHTGRAQMREQGSEKIGLWRQDVKAAALDAKADDFPAVLYPLDGPLQLEALFYFPRPRSHYRTGRNAHLLRDNAPTFPITRATGDGDKLLRSTADALQTAGMFGDDSQLACLVAWKFYADACQPGATITIRTMCASRNLVTEVEEALP